MMLKPPFKLPTIALLTMALVVTILFVSQNYVHFTYTRETAKANETYLLKELADSIPPRLLYPLATSDTAEIVRVAKQIANSDYVHSIEIIDSKGELITYQADAIDAQSKGISVVSKKIDIVDDRVIALDEIEGEQSSQAKTRMLGSAVIQITQHTWQERTERSLFHHQLIFLGANLIVALLFICIIIYMKRYIGARIQSLKSLSSGKYQQPEKDGYIAELNNLDDQINQIAESVVTAIENLKAADTYKRTMLEFVSHELRQPLNSLGPILHLLKEQTDTVQAFENIAHLVNICNASTEQLISVLDQLVDVSLMDSGRYVYQENQFSIEAFFDNLYTIFQGQNTKGIEFSLKSPNNHSELTGLQFISDEPKFIRIFSNVLSNAFKFTDHGNITIEWNIENVEGLHYLVSSIQDTGCGISDPVLSNVFKVGFRENHKIEGKGIGLALVGSLVRFLDGDIKLESKRNIGTRIDIKLPVKMASITQDHSNTQGFEGLTAVVIDDNPNNCFVLESLLKKRGIECYSFVDPIEATQKSPKIMPDIVFVDYSMPALSGTEVIEALRPFELTVVCVTAHVQPAVLQELNEIIESDGGLRYVLRKPIAERELTHILSAIHGSKRAIATILTNLKKE